MRVRPDIVRMYKEVHGWVGIVAGLALFIAFYAGAITMFSDSVQRWASPPTTLGTPPPLERTPELLAKAFAAHPEARKRYEVALRVDGTRPARLSWTTGGRSSADHAPRRTIYASLDSRGALLVSERQPSQVGVLIDTLHEHVGLPFDRAISRPIMGAISLLYVIALVSGTVVLLPSLVSDLFAVRVGRNVKRMWLDVHNVLGLFSLPFHFIMAFSAIVFAFHDQFYDAQGLAFGQGRPPAEARIAPSGPPLAPAQVVAALGRQAPGFTPVALAYTDTPDHGLELRVSGTDPRHAVRGRIAGFVEVDPYSGRMLDTDYMPGHQDGWSAAVSSFFSLHFGSFGGVGVRWAYVGLGLAGAMLFYTGNLLWVESRRRRERSAGTVRQTRATRLLGALTVGVPLGCVAGISLTVAAAKFFSGQATAALHSAIYYAVFVAFTAWALWRGAARAGVDLTRGAALLTMAIPTASLLAGRGWYANGASPLVDVAAVLLAAMLWLTAGAARRRVISGPGDSVWARPPAAREQDPS